jgi:hypothetical protein
MLFCIQKSLPSFSTTCCRVWWPEATNILSDIGVPCCLERHIENKKVKHEILHSIGLSITDQWIEKQHNPKLKGFVTSAEQCRRELIAHRTGTVVIALLMTCGVYIFIANSILFGGMMIAGVLGIKSFMINFLAPGTTAQEIAKVWTPLRKKLIQQGVISKFAKVLKKDPQKLNFIPKDDVRPLLVRSIDELMGLLWADLIEVQREGFPQKEACIRRKMLELKILSHDLGLQMSFDQYFV